MLPSNRILLARAHASNGLANRLAGLRGALRLAEATNRRLVVEWAAGGQEGNWLEPADGVGWRLGPGPGAPPPSDLDNVGLRTVASRRAVLRFLDLANTSRPLVVVSNLWHDLSFVPMGASNVSVCRGQYARLLRPSLKLHEMTLDHVVDLDLEYTPGWTGLQIRRSDHLANSLERYEHRHEVPLGFHEKQGIATALQTALSPLEYDTLFLTTNSRAVQRYVLQRSPSAHTTSNASHLRHSAPRRGYLAPLLEFMVLSLSTRIVGTAGSSFAAEAAYFGNVSDLVLGDWNTFRQLPKAARVQGARNAPSA